MRRLRGEGGATVVEFALVVPVLLVVMIVLLDLGRTVDAYVTVSSASREGARYASVHPTAAPAAIAAAVGAHSAPLSSPTVTASYYNGATFQPWPANGVPASAPKPTSVPIRVQVSYPWSAVTAFLGQFMQGRTFTTSSTMDTVR
ncbi:hypothetical protein BH18CHL2_BH18CHL2_03650 [soil metagenome]